MKWHKFRALRQDAPWIVDHIGPPILVSAPLNHPRGEASDKLRKFVRHNLEFVASRPFHSLNLDSGNQSDGTTEQWTNTAFCVRLHVVNVDEAAFYRLRYVSDPHLSEEEGETSIRKVLLHLKAWQKQCWLPKDKMVSIDAIVKTKKFGNRKRGLVTESIEVFYPPSNLLALI